MPFCTKHSGHWSLITALMVVGFILAGCKGGEKAARGAQASEAKDSRTAEERGDVWWGFSNKDSAVLELHAKNTVRVADNESTPILIVGCGKTTMLVFRVPGTLPASKPEGTAVDIAFDGAPPIRQKWIGSDGERGEQIGLTATPAALEVVTQMQQAKTLKFDFTPRGGSPQSATFTLLDFKSVFQEQPRCDSWRNVAK